LDTPSYSSINISKIIQRRRWTEHIACIGEIRTVHIILVGTLEGKRPLGSPRCRCEDIKMDLKQGVRVWTGLSGLG